MGFQLKNPEAPATAKQLWFLKVLTDVDYTDKNLTMQEVSDLIAKAKAMKPVSVRVSIEPKADGSKHTLKELMGLFLDALEENGIEYTK